MPAPHSTFITVLACFLIASAGFSTAIGLLQTLFFGVTFSLGEFKPGFSAEKHGMSGITVLFFENFVLLCAIYTALSAATLVAGIGLILRKNWGRLSTRAMLVIAALGGIVATAAQVAFTATFWSDAPVPAVFEYVTYAMMGGYVVGGLVYVALLGWVIWRLGSPVVRREFGVA